MARRFRHHRKVHSTPRQATPDIAAESTAQPATNLSMPLSELNQDLRKTAFITLGLFLILLIGGYLNSQFGWTQSFGNLLYRLLHIG